MKIPPKTELSNTRVDYWKEDDTKFIIDGWVDPEGVEIIAVFKNTGSSWISVEENILSGEDLDKISDLLLTKFEDQIESDQEEEEMFEDDSIDDFGLLDYYSEEE